jgi:outer membrane protein OmpA-like peptidoglycan-associated protein
MKTLQYLIPVTFVALLFGCATLAPNELVNARSAYRNASNGPAERLAPAELHKAHEALLRAEQSFLTEPDSYKTKDLAYVAQRKSEQAGALGALAADTASKDRANADFQKQQAEIVKQGKQDLSDSEKQTAMARAELDKLAAVQAAKDQSDADFQRLQAEKKAQELRDADKASADALVELATLAMLREEERGLVLTLSGSVLFQSAQSNLMSSARVKLDQVTHALLAVRARNLIVEGHTDSQGSDSYNQGLSERRAYTVRDYLVQGGYPGERIQSRGMGEGNAIADNASAEGRANNRRVEIIIERELRSSNP